MSDPHRAHRLRPAEENPPEPDAVGVWAAALAGVAAVVPRPEVELGALPAPRRIAQFSHAVSAAVVDPDGDEIASGRFVLLHEPDGHEEWGGVLRCVTLTRADLEPEIAADPLLPEVAWSWLTEALEHHGTGARALGGTVSRCDSTGFGELASRTEVTSVELRASWTPPEPPGGWTAALAQAALTAHFSAWLDQLATAAGLPPLVSGVTVLPGRQPSR